MKGFRKRIPREDPRGFPKEVLEGISGGIPDEVLKTIQKVVLVGISKEVF